MKNKNFCYSHNCGVQIKKLMVFAFLLTLSFFIGNQQVISQSSHHFIDHKANTNNSLVGDDFEQEILILINNASFVSSSIAITILEENLVDIGQMIENGNLPPKQEVELNISFQFRYHILKDLKNGSSVKVAFENNLNNFSTYFIEFAANNHGIIPQELFNQSMDLVTQ